MILVPMSATAALMIIIVLGTRLLLLKYLPKKTFTILWKIILLRLILPFSFPSRFSIYSFVNRHRPYGVRTHASKLDILFLNGNIPGASGDVPASPDISTMSFWTIVWAAGFVLCTLYFVLSYLKCKGEFSNSCEVENDFLKAWLKKHPFVGNIQIRRSGCIQAPLSYGIFHAVILLPEQTNWTDIESLEYILMHEYVHIRYFDGIFKLLLTAALCLHWFNPLVWIMYSVANKDIEMRCDDAVISSFGGSVKSAYALLLIRMEEKKNGISPFFNRFSQNPMKERIKNIMGYRKATILTAVAAFFITAGVTAIFATSAFAEAAPGLEPFLGKTRKSPSKPEETIVYESVEVLQYDKKPPYYPYLHDIKTNNTSKKITGCKRGMLVFDKKGNPLSIKWYPFDEDTGKTYYFLYDWDTTRISPGHTDDLRGGWSLDEKDPVVKKIAYALYCDKEVTFSDGTVWENPNYKKWLRTYKDRKSVV